MIDVRKLHRLTRARGKRPANQCDHMPAGGNAGGLVSAHDLLESGLVGQLRRRGRVKRKGELAPLRISARCTGQCAEFPEHASSRAVERVAGACPDERCDLFVRQSASADQVGDVDERSTAIAFVDEGGR